MEKWICCGHDIIELCNRAGCTVPARCFFCGELRKTVTLSPQPEDWLAHDLAELWSGKIREFHGDPESHFPSLDQYGSTDVEAWRAVARRVLNLIFLSSPLPPDGTPVNDKPDSQVTRDALVKAIQLYAEEWAGGRSTIQSAAKTALSIALDRHEFEVWDKSRFNLVLDLTSKSGLAKSLERIDKESCGSLDDVLSDRQAREHISRSATYGKPDIQKE